MTNRLANCAALKIHSGIPEEKAAWRGDLPRCRSTLPYILIQHVAAVQLANAVVAQAGPLANGEGAGFVADQSQRQIQSLAVPCIAVIGHSHGRLPPWCNSRGFGLKKNLTEINHKVSVVAKWFRCVIAAVFAVKCAGTP
jgi:hypothetical protein